MHLSEETIQLRDEIKNYIRHNLRLEINEKSYGFNGSEIQVKLILGDEELSVETIDVKNDEG